MNDVRFLWAQQVHRPPRADDRASLEEIALNFLSNQDVQDYLTAWWSQAQNANPKDKSDGNGTTEFAKQFNEFLSEDRMQADENFKPIAFTVGAFLADTIDATNGLDEFLLATDIIAKVYEAKLFFYQRLAERLRGDKKAFDLCLSVFRKIPHESNELVESRRFVEGEITGGEQQERSLLERSDLLSLWDSYRGHLELKRTILRQIQFLILFSPAALSDILDVLPFQGLRQALLDDILAVRDPDLISELLRTAPEAVSAEGTWNKRVSVLNAVDMAFQYAKSLESAVAHAVRLGEFAPNQNKTLVDRAKIELPSLQEKELPKWLNSVAETVLARSDGKFVLLSYLIHLLREVRFVRHHNNANKVWPAEKVAAEIFTKKLSTTSLSAENILSFSKNNGGEDRNKALIFLLGAANIQEERPQSKDVSNELWAAYESLLSKKDSEVVAQANPLGKADTWVFTTLGEVLIRTEDAISVFSKSFEKLYPQRRKMRFSYEYGLLEPTRHLLEVGFGALQIIISGDTHTFGIDLWRLLTEKSWAFYFASQERGTKQREDVARCYAYLPFVCKSQPSLVGTIIAEHKESFEADPHISVIAAFLLSKNGLEAKEVCSLFEAAGVRLQEHLSCLAEWDTLTSREGKPNMNIPAIKEGLGIL